MKSGTIEHIFEVHNQQIRNNNLVIYFLQQSTLGFYDRQIVIV